MFASGWAYSILADTRETVMPNADTEIYAADGDSFAIGTHKLRLKGIDAPELHQTCKDAAGADWACGAAAHGALMASLAEPGLSCITEAQDQYHRAIATCSNSKTTDIAAAQVRAGMAISENWMNMRSYGAEEDEAKTAKRGIWRGEFMRPADWRAAHPQLK